MRRSTYTATAVTYGSVGGTQAVDLMTYPPRAIVPPRRAPGSEAATSASNRPSRSS
ncbi:hypothetical protein BC477_15105 [Clavibacter michiganensis subsp. michiganensis]|uniref:Uncharacterized protein n=1 Tax=Clavibacter michiganensis subsp. michiganensis TaxID=33013 RepID=A0A251XDW6_CLAMM|nr:hypothetical protein BC477_15105 [Clavibacter michiganensis subsp. michiganensis]OUD99833.1 hypothetical protein CMMCAS07_20375 [Clavibacter michiganensis subsp. michiganensis]